MIVTSRSWLWRHNRDNCVPMPTASADVQIVSGHPASRTSTHSSLIVLVRLSYHGLYFDSQSQLCCLAACRRRRPRRQSHEEFPTGSPACVPSTWRVRLHPSTPVRLDQDKQCARPPYSTARQQLLLLQSDIDKPELSGGTDEGVQCHRRGRAAAVGSQPQTHSDRGKDRADQADFV